MAVDEESAETTPPVPADGPGPSTARHRRYGLHRWRRATQALSVALFFALLTLTVWPLGGVFLGAFLAGDPLIALNSAVNGIVVWPLAAIALTMITVPLVAGRVFCGWACPMGAVIEWTTPSRGSGRLSLRGRERLRALPTFVLIGSAAALLFASGSFLLLDPLSTLTRSATVLLYPLLDRVIRLLGDVLYLVPAIRPGVDVVTGWLDGRLVFTQPLAYALSVATLAFFASLLAASWIEPRMWCRDVCPLGALLGLAGRFSLLGRHVDAEACTSCGACAKACPMDAVRDGFHATDTSRCELGLECADACPVGAVSVGLRPRRELYTPERRTAVGFGGLALLVGFFTFTGLKRAEPDPALVRPPGALPEDAFLATCSRCGQCMKVCPTNVLQPSVTAAGLEGVFTPQLDFRNGFCEWSCSECGKVCPTGAIGRLELPAKRRTVIGRAYIDKNRCIPWADGKTCLVCQELCPVSPKAIAIDTAEVTTPLGTRVRLGRPQVIAERCIGCGVCQHVCPVPDLAAIAVYNKRSGTRGA